MEIARRAGDGRRLFLTFALLAATGLVALALVLTVYYGLRLLRMPQVVPGSGGSVASAPLIGATPSAPGTATATPARPTPIALLAGGPTRPAAARPSATPPHPAGVTVSPTPTSAAPPEAVIQGLPLGKQARSLSCEFQSASDLAWYYGKPYTWEEIFRQVGHDPDGNPHRGFVGHSLDDLPGSFYPDGYGVYAEPIANALRAFGLPAEVHYGGSEDWLRREIALGRPVMVWATANMIETPVQQWTARDGTPVQGARGEHTYLVYGYSREGVWVMDPWDANRRFYSWEVFMGAWDIFGRMAVLIPDTPGNARRPTP